MAKRTVGELPTGEGLTFEKVWAMFQETGKKIEKTDRIVKKLSINIDRLTKNVDDIGSSVGSIVENLIHGGLQKQLTKKLGMTITDVEQNLKCKHKSFKIEFELDCVMVGVDKKNVTTVILCECKANLDKRDVEYFLDRRETYIKGLQEGGSYLKIPKKAQYIFLFGYSKIDYRAKREIELRSENNIILQAKVGGDGTVTLL